MRFEASSHDNEILSDDQLVAKLDEHRKWELRTEDADFDTHYHTLREALTFAGRMNEESFPVHAISTLDGSVFVDEEQLVRMLARIGARPISIN